jgi:hypothetical protein
LFLFLPQAATPLSLLFVASYCNFNNRGKLNKELLSPLIVAPRL